LKLVLSLSFFCDTVYYSGLYVYTYDVSCFGHIQQTMYVFCNIYVVMAFRTNVFPHFPPLHFCVAFSMSRIFSAPITDLSSHLYAHGPHRTLAKLFTSC